MIAADLSGHVPASTMTGRARHNDIDPPLDESSGVIRITSLASQMREIRVAELPAERLAAQLFRGLLRHDAAHGALQPSGSGSSRLRYHVGGRWLKPQRVANGKARALGTQLERLANTDTASCCRGVSHTLELSVGRAPRVFRLHLPGGGLPTVISAPVVPVDLLIINSTIKRERRRRYDDGMLALERGDLDAARHELSRALELTTGLGVVVERVRILTALARCNKQTGQLLAAEGQLKKALALVTDNYGHDDYQRVTLLQQLSRCAAQRGDHSVAHMWDDRAERLSALFVASS